MKNKNTIFYGIILLSTGYLIYNYIFVDYSHNVMMNHHYGYYGSKYVVGNYFNSILVFAAYSMITVSIIALLSRKWNLSNGAVNILDERLSNGEISIDEYRQIKKEFKN